MLQHHQSYFTSELLADLQRTTNTKVFLKEKERGLISVTGIKGDVEEAIHEINCIVRQEVTYTHSCLLFCASVPLFQINFVRKYQIERTRKPYLNIIRV